MSNPPTQPTPRLGSLLAADRVRFGLFITLFGLLIFIIGAKPEWFNLNRSPVIGLAQICVFLVGLAIICLGGYLGLVALWGTDEKSIGAEIGLRLVATGYVIAVFTGMADIFGMSAQDNPRLPFFGPWQQAGVEIGMVTVAIGMLLLVPWQRLRGKS